MNGIHARSKRGNINNQPLLSAHLGLGRKHNTPMQIQYADQRIPIEMP